MKLKAWDARKNTWISEATWKIVDERFSACQYPAKDQSLIWRLGRAIAASLKGNRRRREEEAGEELEALFGLDPPLHWKTWYRIMGWYWAAFDHAPPPAWLELEMITEDRVELYNYVPYPGENIIIPVEPFPVD